MIDKFIVLYAAVNAMETRRWIINHFYYIILDLVFALFYPCSCSVSAAYLW